MPRKLSIDIETYSPRDIKKGMYVYAEYCEIMLFAYAYDDEPAQIIDTWCEPLPDGLLSDLTDPEVIKHAFNAPFEIECIEQFYKLKLDPMQWRCTLVRSAMCGLPLSLGDVAKVMRVKNQKDKIGDELIKLFCVPQTPTVRNKNKTRIMPYDEPKKWQQFRGYCIGDVEAERDVANGLQFYRIQKLEHEYWCMDQRMNKRGVLISQELARSALYLHKIYLAPIAKEFTELTGVLNAKSHVKLAAWFTSELGVTITGVNKETLPAITALAQGKNDKVMRVINLRNELNKTSIAKYSAMLLGINRDGRIRGCFQYYGANRTGRAAGRLVQLHNIPKTQYKYLDPPRDLTLNREYEFLEYIYGDISSVLSKLIRTAFVAPNGQTLRVVDFAAVEARITAWLAGETWRLEAFTRNDRIYSISAAKIFKIPIADCGKGTKWDDIGKICELAFGFGGGIGAMMKFGADRLGLPAAEMEGIKNGWRAESPNIVLLWKTFEKAAKHCISTGETVACMYGINFSVGHGFMFITLPSGRKLSYYKPSLEYEEGSPYGPRIVYWGMDQETKKWTKMDTYGGKLTENIVQAIGRDLLYHGAKRLEDAGYNIVMHVHDEVVIEGDSGDIHELEQIMSVNPSWAPGLPLGAEGFESPYYKK